MKSFLPGIVLILSIQADAQIRFVQGAAQHTKDFRSGVAVMVTDVNGDGRDDIVRMHGGTRVTVTLQGQDGRFLTTYFFQMNGGEQWNITGGDIDNDGNFDIVTSGAYDRVKLFRSIPFSNDYNTESINDQTFFAQSSNLADIDSDGFLDLFVCNDDEKSVIFMNDSTGNLVRNDTIIDFTTLVPSDNSGNYGSIWTDFDSDGDLDLHIAKCRQGVTDPTDPRRINALYLNNGDSTYTEAADSFNLAIGAQSWTADFGDIDNDGDFDLFITNHDVAGMLLENIDNAYFEDITDAAGVQVLGIAMQGTFRDFDNDGLQDLIVSGSTNYLFQNIGDRQFLAVDLPSPDRPISSYGIGDLNSDGFLDIYATYNELFNDPHPILEDVMLFNSGNENHFVTINLTGTHCNVSAVGARANLYGSWGMQTREVRAGEGYGITNTFTQHFGVGSATLVDSLVVIWPCGMKEVFPELAVDINYYLEEGKCLTQLLDVTSGPFTQCGGLTFSLTAPEGFAEYLWSTGSTEQEITTMEPGVFHVSLTDDLGCTWVAGPFIVSPVGDEEPDSIDIIIDGRIIACAGDEIVLTGPVDAVEYLWSNGETTSSIAPSVGGEYSLQALYACNTFSSDTVSLTILDPNDLVIANDTILGGGSGELVVTGDSILWFIDPDGQNPVATGQIFVTPSVDTTTTFYAQQTKTIVGEHLTAGQPDHTGVTLYNSSQSNGAVRFDVYDRFRIDSVLVITAFSGNRTVLVIDAVDDTLYSQTFAIDSGRTYLPLDVWLEPGTDYLMTTHRDTNQETFGVNSPRLVRSDRDFLYPFTVQNVLSITGTQSSQQFYYYFYDWHITREDQYCVGDLIPGQVVVVDTTSSATFTPNVESIDLIPNPTSDYVSVGDATLLTQALNVAVYDARGLRIGGWEVDGDAGRLLVAALPDGMYFVRILLHDKTYLGQFVKM